MVTCAVFKTIMKWVSITSKTLQYRDIDVTLIIDNSPPLNAITIEALRARMSQVTFLTLPNYFPVAVFFDLKSSFGEQKPGFFKQYKNFWLFKVILP